MVGLADAVGFYERNPLYAYDATRGALEFHKCAAINRMFRAPNQCLGGETLIPSPNGPSRRIDSLEGWFRVWAWNGTAVVPALAVANPVRGPDPLYRVTLSNGETFRATGDHRLLGADGLWRETASLRPGFALASEPPVVVLQVAPCGTDWHYDMQVPGYENFVANGVVHHNCGKTWAGIVEDWWHLTGRHPYRTVNLDHQLGYIMLADLDNAYAEFCAKMWALAPRDEIHPACRFVPGKGFFFGSRRLIVMKNGRRAEFRSGEGPVTGSSGGTAGWLHLDEPPKQGHFYEITARVLATGGPIWMTFTPVGRPVDWLRRHVEGDPEYGIAPAEPWTQIVPKLTVEDCTTVRGKRVIRSQEQIDAQRAKYRGSPEYRQRVEGDWEGASEGRRFPAFGDAHVIDDDQLPTKLDEIRLSTDHGTTVGAQVAYLIGIAGKRIYLLDEWVGTGNTSSRTDARAMLDMLKRYGLTVHHVGKAFGDVNSAGKNQGGATMNAKLEEAFMEELALSAPPFQWRAPRKGSVLARERAINTKLLEREWFVHKRCKAWIKSASYYTGREEDLKHAIDGAGYGVVDLLGVPARTDRMLVG